MEFSIGEARPHRSKSFAPDCTGRESTTAPASVGTCTPPVRSPFPTCLIRVETRLLARRHPIRRRTQVRFALAVTIVALTAWVAVVYVVPAAQLGRRWSEIERVSLDAALSDPAEDVAGAASSDMTMVDPSRSIFGDTDASNGNTEASNPGSSPSDRSRDARPKTSARPIGSAAPAPTPRAIGAESAAKTSTKHAGQLPATPTLSTLRNMSTVPDEVPDAALIVGSDSRSELDDASHFGSFAGQRADVIVLALFDGPDITLVSLPRDLAVPDTCRGGTHKIGEAYAGCGDTPGLVQLVTEVSSVTGIRIDHAVSMEMAGFENAVDAFGGYEICPEYPLRDDESGLDVAAGCQLLDGRTTLAWIRSRHTERRVDGRWELYPAVSDLVRNERERTFLIGMLHRIGVDLGINEMLSVGDELAPYLTIDDQLSIREAVRLGWQFRNAEVTTVEIPVVDDRLADGSAVLTPTTDPAEVIDDALGG